MITNNFLNGLVSLFLLLIISCSPNKKSSLPAPLLRAHAHNDYQHPHPLYDALANGFVSIEADIHLIDEELYVAHDRKDIIIERTLQVLYLDPLNEIIKENGGYIYGKDIPFTLLIDIKTDADSTYLILSALLKEYENMITTYNYREVERGAVTIIVSGNRNLELMKNINPRYATYDGRPNDLDSNISSMLIPLISANWNSYFKWKGKGKIPVAEKEKLKRIIDTAHQQGKQVRFWATDVAPSRQQNFWKTLLENNVGFIGTDKLKELNKLLTK